MGKHYTDKERLDHVKRYRQSGKTMSEYTREQGINRSTMKDWETAYNHLEGDFIRMDQLDNQPGRVLDEEQIKMNLIEPEEILKKSTKFSRFDHSIVVIETKQMKITTSLTQAIRLVELIYDRL